MEDDVVEALNHAVGRNKVFTITAHNETIVQFFHCDIAELSNGLTLDFNSGNVENWALPYPRDQDLKNC